MVLINELTIDEINAALVHLQRSRTEIVGGAKGDTVNNILINNTGGGNSVDYSNIIDIIQNRLNAHDKTIENDEKRLEENESLDSTQQEQIESLFAQLEELSNNGIQSLQFDATNRYLIIYTQDGNTYDVEIPSETVTMSFDSATNKLIFQMGNQTQEVVLPFINTSQMGVAGGVATLDENGRVPYSQLPESAMEFKGEWNASTNTPTLADGTGTNGHFYICSAGGTVNFGTVAEPRLVTFVVNDRVIYEGDTDQWVKLPAGQVASVNGQSGVVELDADDIPYDATMSVKDKLDSASQADWTETDPTEPSFIKHKIPIWITQGSADDNMSPIDSVTDGSMRPVTSNAVFDKHYLTSADITNQVTVDNMQSVSSNAVYTELQNYATNGHFLKLPNPIGNIRYAKIRIKNYTKVAESVFIAFNCYSMWGVIRESNQCFYRGTLYGIQGISYTPYTSDNNDFFWIKWSNYRSVEFVSSKELELLEITATAPSGVTFTAPVAWT